MIDNVTIIEEDIHTITVPLGRWVRRNDEKPEGKFPVMAYGMESCVLVVWSDGSHTTRPVDSVFPASNWKVWEDE